MYSSTACTYYLCRTISPRLPLMEGNKGISNMLGMSTDQCVRMASRTRDGKTTIFFGLARSSFPRPVIQFFFNFRPVGPVWTRLGPLGPRQNLLSLMF